MEPEEKIGQLGSIAPFANGADGFAINEQPLVESSAETVVRSNEIPASAELPRSYSNEPALFAIARDPQTVFVYWDINWPNIFGDHPPSDQKVYVRFESSNADSLSVEPSAGSCYLSCAKTGLTDRLEIGFFEPAYIWHSVAFSNSFTMPSAGIVDEGEFNIVTVPFHLHFQRLLDLFRASKYDGATLTGMVSAVQSRAERRQTASPLNEAEQRILQAMQWPLSSTEVQQRHHLHSGETAQLAVQQRLKHILASSGGEFTGSSSHA